MSEKRTTEEVMVSLRAYADVAEWILLDLLAVLLTVASVALIVVGAMILVSGVLL